jgi:hypothetical protein
MKHILTVTIASMLFGVAGFAQMTPPKPAPELKKLDFFLGSWTTEGDMKPSPYGPGGKLTGSDHVEWMQGNYFMIIHSKFSSASMGDGVEYAVMGYDSHKKQYTYESFNSMGEHDVATCTPDADGKTWTWYPAPGDSSPMKWRFTETILSPSSYAMKFDVSQDGTTWSSAMEGKATKQQ